MNVSSNQWFLTSGRDSVKGRVGLQYDTEGLSQEFSFPFYYYKMY
jgi:hypothetical protein